jgi:serine kinase of HPr protein (carbohydrate metabolism regulator)
LALHATLVARWIDGRARGALVRGPSGRGKSTLALRCVDAGFQLVADDRVLVFASAGRLFGKAPPPLVGLLEVRGVGVISAPGVRSLSQIDLVVDLVERAERLPEPRSIEIGGVVLSGLELPLDNPDLPLRISVALAALQRRL